MRSTFRHYGAVALLLAGILLVSTLLSLFTGSRQGEDQPRILVTTYPLYVAAQNILGDTDGVELTLLSGAGAGCLHDYQLTPADRLAIEKADRIIINGAGDDELLTGLVDSGRVVYTSAGLQLLCAHENHDGHGHVLTDHDAYNEHVWLSPENYKKQMVQVALALRAVDTANSVAFSKNAAAYSAAIDAVAERLPDLSGRPCVLFHDSLSYLAEDVGLDVKLTLSAEGESGISAADLAKVEQLAKQYPDLVLLYDTQYPIRYTAVDDLVPAAQVIALESAVVGEGNPSDWLDAMERNVQKLQALQGGDTP